jgi:hypothetical protein
MNWLNTTIALLTAYLLVFFETSMNGIGAITGTQAEFLPVLMVYAGLSMDTMTIVLLAIWGGLWLDSFSLNPLGASLLPLLALGLILQRYRDYILRGQAFAQMVLGAAACLFVAFGTLLVIFLLPGIGEMNEVSGFEDWRGWPLGMSKRVLGGWVLLKHAVIMAASGALFAPVLFKLLDKMFRCFRYPSAMDSSFRPDREIKRGSAI